VPFFGRASGLPSAPLRAEQSFAARGGREPSSLYMSGEKMRRTLTLVSLGLVLLFGSAGQSKAEVKRVRMHIAGYLCGN
jgi:hypothetical protein